MPFLGLKLAIFSVFSVSGPCFLWEGGPKNFFRPNFFSTVFIYLSGLKKSYLETLYLFVEFLYLFLENPKNRFKSLSYLKLKNAQKYPLRLLGENGVCTKSYQKPFISWRFGPIWTHLASQKIGRNFFPPCSIIARAIYVLYERFTGLIEQATQKWVNPQKSLEA